MQWMISKKDSTKGISYNWVNIPAALRDQHAQPFMHTAGKVQIPGVQRAQGQDLTRAGQDCKCSTTTKGTSGEERAPPWLMPYTTNPYNTTAEGRLWLGSWSCRGSRETGRHSWLGMQGDSNQVSPPFLPTAANPTDPHSQKISLKTNPGIWRQTCKCTVPGNCI